jgi:phage protein D
MTINYTPAFNIRGPEIVNQRMQSLTVTDSPGYISDTIRIMVNMEGVAKNSWPKSGDTIGVELGWQETGLTDMGDYTVSKIKPLYLPKRAEIIATSAPFNAMPDTDAKRRRSETYTETTLAEIVQYCAKRMGMSARIHPDFNSLSIVHIDQKNETDLSFLQRLAGPIDAVVKPIDGNLVFSRRGQSKSLTGQSLTPVELQLYKGDRAPFNALLEVDFVEPERDLFQGVKADWFNIDTGEIVRFEKGQSPFKQLPGRYKTELEAASAIDGELRRMKREGIKVFYTAPCNPLLMAEGSINLTGFDDDEQLNGLYSNDKVTHTLIPGRVFKTTGEASALL